MADNSRMDPEGINPISRLRASDADRDRAASVLNEAMAQGRLTAAEHAERLDAIYAAKTHADIVPVIDDLPGASLPAPPSAGPGTAVAASRGRRIVAVFSGISRKGRWQPEPVTRIVAVFGGAELDLRDAVLPGREITINVVAVFGGAEITGDTAESAGPDAPVLHLTGACVFGGVGVKRKPRRNGNGRELR